MEKDYLILKRASATGRGLGTACNLSEASYPRELYPESEAKMKFPNCKMAV